MNLKNNISLYPNGNRAIKNISNIIEEIKIGINYEISGDDFIMSIRPTKSFINFNSTQVDFEIIFLYPIKLL